MFKQVCLPVGIRGHVRLYSRIVIFRAPVFGLSCVVLLNLPRVSRILKLDFATAFSTSVASTQSTLWLLQLKNCYFLVKMQSMKHRLAAPALTLAAPAPAPALTEASGRKAVKKIDGGRGHSGKGSGVPCRLYKALVAHGGSRVGCGSPADKTGVARTVFRILGFSIFSVRCALCDLSGRV